MATVSNGEIWNIDTVDVSCRKKYETGTMSLREVRETLYKCGWFNYVPSEEQALKCIYSNNDFETLYQRNQAYAAQAYFYMQYIFDLTSKDIKRANELDMANWCNVFDIINEGLNAEFDLTMLKNSLH